MQCPCILYSHHCTLRFQTGEMGGRLEGPLSSNRDVDSRTPVWRYGLEERCFPSEISGNSWYEYKGELDSSSEVGGKAKCEGGGEIEGNVGIENGIEGLEGRISASPTLQGNDGEVGEVCGVLLRTYVEIGVFAVRSVKDKIPEESESVSGAAAPPCVDEIYGEDGG
jgi:hypothetical protein